MNTDRLLVWTFGIFAIVVTVGFLFFYTRPPAAVPHLTTTPLSSEEQALLSSIIQAQVVPASKEDEERLDATVSASTKPLSSPEETYFKKVVGG
jgi:hypothetical protein